MHAADPVEKRANAFAAAFLMPEVRIREAARGWEASEPSDIEFSAMVMELGVSPSALAWRLFNIRLIGEFRRTQLSRFTTARCAQLANGAARLAEWTEQSQQARVPAALAQDMVGAYLDGLSTLRPFANLLRADVAVLHDILENSHEESPTASAEELTFAP
jgi:hypothetical protein